MSLARSLYECEGSAHKWNESGGGGAGIVANCSRRTQGAEDDRDSVLCCPAKKQVKPPARRSGSTNPRTNITGKAHHRLREFECGERRRPCSPRLIHRTQAG